MIYCANVIMAENDDNLQINAKNIHIDKFLARNIIKEKINNKWKCGYSRGSVMPDSVIANVASLSGMSGES